MSLNIGVGAGVGFNSVNGIGGGGGGYILDDFPNALGAFSLRKLSSTYTGSVLRVRRNNLAFPEVVDIDFDSNDVVSMDSPVTAVVGTTLATNLGEFVVAPGYSDPDGIGAPQTTALVQWYDQSGNGWLLDQTASPAWQPAFNAPGAFYEVNSKPSIYFDGSNDTLFQWDVFGLEATATDIVHYSVQYIEDEKFIFARGGHGGDYYGTGEYANTTTGSYGSSPGSSPPNDWYVNGVALPKTLPAGGPFTDVDRDSVFYALSNYLGSTPPASAGQTLATFTGINFISWSYPGPGLAEYELWSYGGGYNIKGKLQELILYNAPDHPVQADLETAINTYYSIYYVATDPDAIAFINAIYTAGGSLTDTEKEAINDLVIDLKEDGLWTKMYAIWPFVGATAVEQKFNLKDPRDLDVAYRLTFAGGWTHATTGAKGNKVDTWASTWWNPKVDIPLNGGSLDSASWWVYLRNGDFHNDADWGGTSTEVPSLHEKNWNCANRIYNGITMATLTQVGVCNNAIPPSFCGSNRTTSTLLTGYHKGLDVGDSTTPYINQPDLSHFGGGAPTWPAGRCIALGGISQNITVSYKNAREFALASTGAGLSAEEALTFYNTVQAFQTTLGRQV